MNQTLRDMILARYRSDPTREYVRCYARDGTSASLTYGGLVGRASQFADQYAALGAPEGGTIVVLLPHSTDLYSAFFGAVLGRRVPAVLAVPSFKLSRDHYQHEIAALLTRIDAHVVVTDTDTAASLTLADGRIGRAKILVADRLAPQDVPIPHPEIAPEDIVLLQHSSGSTGLKKGVALSNRAVLRQITDYASRLDLTTTDRIASWLPLYHDMGLIACAILPAMTGVPVSALSPLHWVTNPGSLLRVIATDGCTLAWMPNFAYEFLATRVRRSQTGGIRLDSMRGWINCSEPTVAASHRRFLERYEPMGVRPETLWTCYAMAETTFAVSQSTPDAPARVEQVDRARFQESRQAQLAEPGAPSLEVLSGGRLLAGTHVRIVSNSGDDLADRHVGEIAVQCGSMFSGYFRDSETTAQALRDGWYFTGDLGYLADGHLFITGRKKDLLIISGKNYYPQDIEHVVSSVDGIYPGRVVALGVDDEAIGTQRLVVLAEVAGTRDVGDADLAMRVRRQVSERFDCVVDDLRLLPHMWLLKTSSGKIARRPNLERYQRELLQPSGVELSSVDAA